MARSKSSNEWLREHFSDPYVLKAQQEGRRSRAAYKLLEIQAKTKLIKPRMTVVDLGAAPGGWSEVAAELVGKTGRVIALDILPMEPIPGVEFIQGDFTELEAEQQLLAKINSTQVDLIISDMAPNISGIRSADQAGSIYLVELAIEFAQKILAPKGALLVKIFQGSGFPEVLLQLRQTFSKVTTYKPAASRNRSREVFLLAMGLKTL